MPKKAFLVEVQFNIQAVTCPGVWLCPKGSIFLYAQMLGSDIQTEATQPAFPIIINERFLFSRTFYDVGRLGSLQKLLNKEMLYMELIQWQPCTEGNVLATFQTSLAQLLFPESRNAARNSEIDLLMDPTCAFPGILAPKIEVSTKTTIQDKFYNAEENAIYEGRANPSDVTHLTALRTCPQTKCATMRQRPVCHTKKCNSKICFNKLRHGPLNIRDPGNTKQVLRCKDRCGQKDLNANKVHCATTEDHSDNCVVCAKYKHYFESQALKSFPPVSHCPCIRKYTNEYAEDHTQLSNYPVASQCKSTVQKLHERISKSLSCCTDYIDNEIASKCDCTEMQSCLGETMDQFYKKHMSVCGSTQ